MEQNILGLLNPLIMLTFSMTFFAFWLVQRKRRYILAIAGGYLTFGCGMFVSNIGISANDVQHVLGTHFFYSMTCLLFVWAVSSRHGQPSHMRHTFLLAIGIAPILIWIHQNSGIANLRIIVANITYSAILFVGVIGLWRNRKNHRADFWLFVLFALTAVQFVIRPIAVLAFEGGVTNQAYLQSIYYSILNVTMAILALLLALTFLAICVVDYFHDLPKKPSRAGTRDSHSSNEARIGRLKRVMESNIHQQHDLSVADLAKATEIQEHQLSALIIQTMGYKNFRDFLNSYRLEQVEAALSDRSLDCASITTIAFDAGFNSIPSFNRVFKARFDMAPSRYRDQQRAKK